MEEKILKLIQLLWSWKPTHRNLRKYGRQLTEQSIEFWVNLNSFVHLIKFEKNSHGVYRSFDKLWRRVLHKIVIAIILLLTFVHSTIAISEVQASGLTVRSLFGITYAVAYTTASLTVMCLSFWADELADWWNAAISMSAHLTNETRTLVSPLNTYKTMLQIVPTIFFTLSAVPILTAQSFIFINVPSHLATALESRMALPKVEIFGVAIPWRVICIPAEIIHNGLPGSAVTLATTIVAYGLATNATVVSFLQAAPVTSSVQRKKMHRLYISLQLYNQLLGRAYYSLIPCGIFLMMATTTFALYVTVVDNHLPLVLRALFPLAGAIGFMITVIVSENATLVGNVSEGVIGKARAYDVRFALVRGKYFARMNFRQAVLYRRIRIQNGPSGFLEPNLPARIAEETINQLLLLLSF